MRIFIKKQVNRTNRFESVSPPARCQIARATFKNDRGGTLIHTSREILRLAEQLVLDAVEKVGGMLINNIRAVGKNGRLNKGLEATKAICKRDNMSQFKYIITSLNPVQFGEK